MTGRTYRYATVEPLYPFGFGLSYTRFAYSNLALEKETLYSGESLRFCFVLANCGAQDGEELAQVYLQALNAPAEAPLTWLVDFRRIALAAVQETIVEWSLPADKMMLVNDAGQLILQPGEYEVTIGGCSPGRRGSELGTPMPVSRRFTIRG